MEPTAQRDPAGPADRVLPLDARGAPRRAWEAPTVAAVLVLNVLDAGFTLGWLRRGEATEANPLFEELASQRPWRFVLVKVALVALGLVILYRYRHVKLARGSLVLALVVYLGLFAYHLGALVTHGL